MCSNSNSALRYRQMRFVRSLKSCACGVNELSSAALAAQPNPIQLSICIWGNANVPTWGARVGHSWRVSPDIQSNWNSIVGIIGISVKSLNSDGFYGHGDMDMMEIGNGALTIQEQRTHFAIWAFLKSPIILGTDVRFCPFSNYVILTVVHSALQTQLNSACYHHQQGAPCLLPG
jgi:alpha-galactosidase